MTTLTIAAAILTFTTGFLFGFIVAVRHVELECETAYLTGHVDGYGKAVADGGEVGL